MSQDNTTISSVSDVDTFKQIIDLANKTNESSSGVGDNSDSILIDDNNYELKKIIPKFNFFDEKIEFRIIEHNFKREGRILVVIPGFSKKSFHWTIGRIYKYINDNTLDDNFKDFSKIYIFDFSEIKNISTQIENDSDKMSELYNLVTKNVDKIIKSFGEKNITILGRSAGGGIAIRLGMLEKNQKDDYIKSIHLCAPGYITEVDSNGNKIYRGLKDYLDIRSHKMTSVPLVITYSIEDTRIDTKEIHTMHTQLKRAKYEKYKVIYISTGKDGDNHNHRIHREAIETLNFY